MDHHASQTHKSVFADYERRKDVDLQFSEENPNKYWKLCEEVGRGAFAVIKKCHRLDDKNQKLFAAKLIKYEMPGDDEMSKIYKDIVKREVAMIQKWDHERLIKLYEVYIVRKYFVLFMEWVDGVNLLQYLIAKQEQAESNKRMKRLSEKDIATLIQQLLEALKYLHDKNIAYLDIKPDNIMVQGNGKIKLVDYDNCRHIVGKTGDVVDCIGTPEMTAPEGLVYENCSTATDLWSVGVLIHIMLTGVSPFADPDEDEVRRKVSKVQYTLNEKIKPLSQYCKDVMNGVFKRIPEKRMKIEKIRETWLSTASMGALGRNSLQVSADDYKKLKQTLEELESEEPVSASCELRTFDEEAYESPEEEEDDD